MDVRQLLLGLAGGDLGGAPIVELKRDQDADDHQEKLTGDPRKQTTMQFGHSLRQLSVPHSNDFEFLLQEHNADPEREPPGECSGTRSLPGQQQFLVRVRLTMARLASQLLLDESQHRIDRCGQVLVAIEAILFHGELEEE